MQICKCTICTNLFFKEKEIMPLVNTKEMFEKAYKGGYAITSSISSRGRTGTRRYIQAWHDRKKLSKMSTIEY